MKLLSCECITAIRPLLHQVLRFKTTNIIIGWSIAFRVSALGYERTVSKTIAINWEGSIMIKIERYKIGSTFASQTIVIVAFSSFVAHVTGAMTL
jgi:hypothetical protein